jgi:hypothetical protein
MEQKEWPLGPASANVVRMGDAVLIELRGFITAQVYEALHLRMAGLPVRDLRLIVGSEAWLVATNESLVEAASRGTGARDDRSVMLLVPRERQAWADLHCLISSDYGLARRFSLLEPRSVQKAATL